MEDNHIRNLLISASGNVGQKFNNSNLRAQSAPHRAHLQADDATTNQNKVFRNLQQLTKNLHTLEHLLKLQSSSAGNASFLVNGEARKRSRLRAGGNDDVP